MSELWIQPTGGVLGADVHGIDLSQSLSDATFERLAEAWAEHLVLRFSGQKLDDPTMMKFSARFGDLDRVPVAAVGFDRMDSGVVKEAEDWVAVIRPANILFEMDGVPEPVAREAMRLAAAKLPMRTRFITRGHA